MTTWFIKSGILPKFCPWTHHTTPCSFWWALLTMFILWLNIFPFLAPRERLKNHSLNKRKRNDFKNHGSSLQSRSCINSCHQWRERQSEKKMYLVCVRWQPPYNKRITWWNYQFTTCSILHAKNNMGNLSMEDRGKVSLKAWQVYESSGSTIKLDSTTRNSSDQSEIILELQHRVDTSIANSLHCIAVWDWGRLDFYSNDRIQWIGDEPENKEQGIKWRLSRPKMLQLHANTLAFMPLKTREEMTLTSPNPGNINA